MKVTIELENNETVDDIDAFSLAQVLVKLKNKYLDIDGIEELGMYLFIYAQHRKKRKKK